MTKEQVLASYRAPAQAALDSEEHAEDRVHVSGGVAVVSGTVTLKGREGGRQFVRTWRVTNVLSRRGGRWQIIVSHASLIT
jgi:ketosteroid isomerase-like protein